MTMFVTVGSELRSETLEMPNDVSEKIFSDYATALLAEHRYRVRLIREEQERKLAVKEGRSPLKLVAS